MAYPTNFPPADAGTGPLLHGEAWDHLYGLFKMASQFKTHRPHSSGLYHWNERPDGAGYSAWAQNRLHFVPIQLLPGFNYTRIGIKVVTAGGAGVVGALAVYDRDHLGVPGDKLVDAGTVAADTTGTKLATINFTPEKSILLAAVCFQGSSTMPTIQGTSNNAQNLAGGLGTDFGESQGYMYQDSVSGALPTTPTPVQAVAWPIPGIMMGVA